MSGSRCESFDILLAEDDTVVACSLQAILTAAGYRVAGPVDSCEGVIEAVTDAPPNLVVMGIRLRGGVDGLETARRLWREFALPCVLVAAFDDVLLLKGAAGPGLIGCIVKPFDNRQLLATVALALQKRLTERDRSQAAWRQDVLSEACARIAAEVEATNRALERDDSASYTMLPPRATAALTTREREVLQLLLRNHRVATIAKLLFVSPHTVRNHLKGIFRKVGVGSQEALIEFLRGGTGRTP